MRAGMAKSSASCAARKRLAPATISKPSEFGRTVMGWMRPCCRMLSALCSVDHFVAHAAESRIEAGGAHSEGHIMDEPSPDPTLTLVANWISQRNTGSPLYCRSNEQILPFRRLSIPRNSKSPPVSTTLLSKGIYRLMRLATAASAAKEFSPEFSSEVCMSRRGADKFSNFGIRIPYAFCPHVLR
jgi:hypothetical protein